MTGPGPTADAAAAWLTHGRFAGLPPDERHATEDLLHGIRDRVLAGARIAPADHVVDLGAGTGLLTRAALPLVGPHGIVTAVDRSAPALRTIPPPQVGMGRLRTVVADATALPLPDATADAVVTRSVLIYIENLRAALDQAARVLKPGGRLSAFEPINARRKHDANLGIPTDEMNRIEAAFRTANPTGRIMTAFTETMVTTLARRAGFRGIDVELGTVTSTLTGREAVDGHLHREPHPGGHSPIAVLTHTLGPDIAARYIGAWHLAVDQQGTITYTTPTMYLTADRTP